MEIFNLCQCGCGNKVNSKTAKFLPGHNGRGRKRSEAEKKRISETMKKIMTNEMKAALSKAGKGRKHTEESKLIMSEKAKERERIKKEKGFIVSQETRLKISKASKGRKHTEESKQKMRDAKRGNVLISLEQQKQTSQTLKKYFKTHVNPFKGRKHTEKSKQKMSDRLKGKYNGGKASNWQGGIDSFPYAIGWAGWYIEKIRERDSHKCQNPKCKNPHKLLDIHHVDYDKQNHDPNNLITLCKKCHGRTQKNREHWIAYYQQIIKNKNITKINANIKLQWGKIYQI